MSNEVSTTSQKSLPSSSLHPNTYYISFKTYKTNILFLIKNHQKTICKPLIQWPTFYAVYLNIYYFLFPTKLFKTNISFPIKLKM